MAVRRRIGDHGHFSVWPVIWLFLALRPVKTAWNLLALHLMASRNVTAQHIGKAMTIQS